MTADDWAGGRGQGWERWRGGCGRQVRKKAWKQLASETRIKLLISTLSEIGSH